ncbi:hypothetical protein BKA62DRAFT_710173 [Auriculariales sp. MPI-PUGE-AT-0066]|nr:hypothetical protein BKA62DRAFT_710173 [Auriculariales sp. MPI-PUGE-AT-0066]
MPSLQLSENLSVATTRLTLSDVPPHPSHTEIQNAVLGLRSRPNQEGTLHQILQTLHLHDPKRYQLCEDWMSRGRRCGTACDDCAVMKTCITSLKSALCRAREKGEIRWLGRENPARKVWQACKVADLNDVVFTGHIFTRLEAVTSRHSRSKPKSSPILRAAPYQTRLPHASHTAKNVDQEAERGRWRESYVRGARTSTCSVENTGIMQCLSMSNSRNFQYRNRMLRRKC